MNLKISCFFNILLFTAGKYIFQISVLIFGNKEEPRMRYMLPAMKYSTFARFAYIYLNEHSLEIAKMREALDLKNLNSDTILIFNDYPQVSF